MDPRSVRNTDGSGTLAETHISTVYAVCLLFCLFVWFTYLIPTDTADTGITSLSDKKQLSHVV